MKMLKAIFTKEKKKHAMLELLENSFPLLTELEII